MNKLCNKYGFSVISALCGLALLSCSGHSGRTCCGEDIKLVPLHNIIYTISRSDSVAAVALSDSCIRRYPAETADLLAVYGYDSLSVDNLRKYAASPAVNVFSPATDSLAPSNDCILQLLSYTLSAASQEGLDLGKHSYATVVWGKLQSVIFCDSTMLIGLNHYLGEAYPGYSSMEKYIRKTKSPAFLPYDLAESLVATAMPYLSSDRAATINRLVYEGALTEAKMRLVKDSSPVLALGYSQDEFDALMQNEKWIWDKMVSSGMVFDHDPSVASRLIAPAPYCGIISASCPGRAGRFIGYRIVQSYIAEHPEAKLSDLLSPSFYNMSNPLSVTAYRPH